jgi:hypothetical protein
VIFGSSCLGLIGPAPQNVEGVPIDSLPGSLKDLVWEVHIKMQVPISAALTSILAVISLSTQGRVRVRRTEDLMSPVSLWFFQIQESGERKSSVLRELTKGIRRFMDEERASHSINVANFKSMKLAWDAEIKGIVRALGKKAEKGEDVAELKAKLSELSQYEPVSPMPFKLLLNDATSEALRNCLFKCYPITSLFSDEGVSLLKTGALSNISLLNQCWDGGDVNIERASEGAFYITDPAVSIFIAVQPKAFEAFHRAKGDLLRDAGFYARSYIVQPPSYAGGRSLDLGSSGQPLIDDFNQRCYSILRDHLAEDGSLKEKRVLVFDPLANQLWRNAFNVWEWHMGTTGFFHDHKDLAAKQAEKVARIAACVHCFTSDGEMISEQSMRAAIDIGNWYLDSTIKALKGSDKPSEFDLDFAELRAWFERNYPAGQSRHVRKSHILQYGPNRTRCAPRLEKVLDSMNRQGFIKYVENYNSRAVLIEPCFPLLRINNGV